MFDALAKAAELRGHHVEIGEGGQRNRGTFIKVDGYRFDIQVREKQLQVEREPDALERALKRPGQTFKGLRPSGLIYLHIKRHEWGYPKKEIRETRNVRIEGKLNDFFRALYRMVDECDRTAEKKRTAERARAEEAERMAERRREAEAENARLEDFIHLVERRSLAKRMREFVHEFREVSDLPEHEIEEKARWMSEKADEFDPFR